MMATRTDVHSPSHLVTENYQYLGALDTAPREDDGYDGGYSDIMYDHKDKQSEIDTALYNWDHRCAHCGAHPRYVALMLHNSGDIILIGLTCLDNRFSLATQDFQRLKKAAELDRQAQKIKAAVREWVAAHPDLAWMGDKHFDGIPETSKRNNFVLDVARKLQAYGSISDKQEAAVRASLVRDVEWAAKRAAEAAERHDPDPAPVIEGRIQVTGRVLTTKDVESQFGWTTKMLVFDDRGFKVWGTVPSSISAVQRGARVRFLATVEKSKDDETFGFYSRPTKAEVVEVK